MVKCNPAPNGNNGSRTAYANRPKTYYHNTAYRCARYHLTANIWSYEQTISGRSHNTS